ncbi:MAG: tetratricopeptide repeat protein [Planctomycetes bacterium]|nr:tetratricopeptide repeat protein [Planctomycetota bacterium]
MHKYLRFNFWALPLLALAAGLVAMAARGGSQPGEWLPGKEMLPGLLATAPLPAAPEDLRPMEGAGGETNEVLLAPESDDNANAEIAASDAGKPAPAAGEAAQTAREYAMAVELLKKGRLDAGEKALQGFVGRHPDHAGGWRQLGDCHYNLGKIDAAVSAYKTALRKDPGNYLARRGLGVAALYLGYEFYEQENPKLAHRYFQQSLQSLHECLERNADDQLAAYGQALAAEGVSRELYRIARKAIDGDNEDTAKNIIRNCLEILDVAVAATEDRLARRPEDNDARMLLGGLFLRRARMLQPFGHVEEASGDLMSAVRAYAPVAAGGGAHAASAKAQKELCDALIKEWNRR